MINKNYNQIFQKNYFKTQECKGSNQLRYVKNISYNYPNQQMNIK